MRVKDAAAAREIHAQLRVLDRVNAFNRAKMNMRLYGEPPLPQKQLNDEGMGDMSNINSGGSAYELKLAQVPYWARIQATDNLVSVKTNYGETSKRADWEACMNEEITRTIRAWTGFTNNTLDLNRKFIWDGIGIAHFENMIDWRFRASCLGEFYFERGSKLDEDSQQIVTAYLPYAPTVLYGIIKNEEIATALGWNVPAVKRAIKKAASNVPKGDDWEHLADQIKNNDLGMNNKMTEVPCIIGYWKEFDQSVTFAICTESAVDKDDFLYVRRGQYTSMQDAFILFTYGLGVNNTIHGMRAMNYDIHQLEYQYDISLNRMIDCGIRQSNFIVQAGDESSMGELALQSMGNYMVLNPNHKAQQIPQINLEQSVGPVLREMERIISSRTGSFTGPSNFGTSRMVKAQAEDEIAQRSKLTTISMDYWDGPFGRLMRQVVKRMTRKNYLPAEPGGREIAELRLRLVKRNVPLDAFYQLDHDRTRIVKAIGNGSKAEQISVFESLQILSPGYDSVGQRKLRRLQTVARAGIDVADELIPRDDSKRQPPDTKIAMLENPQLIAGTPVEVLDGELHSAHAEVHIGALQELWKSYSQGQMPIEEYATKGRELHDHGAEHVKKMSGDMATEQQAAQYRQMLQQLGEDIGNGLKALMAEQKRQQEEGPQPGQDGQPQQDQGPDVDKIAKFEKHQAELKFSQERHQIKMQEMIQEGQLKRQLADAAMAAEIARKGIQR